MMMNSTTTLVMELPFNQVMAENNSHFRNYYYYPPIKQPLYMIVLLSVAYVSVFLLALVGNCLVIAVVYKNPGMRNTTNYFIVNLAIADILVAILCIPLTLLDNIYTGWPFGSVLCKMTPYIQHVSVCASVNTLAVIAMDRYLAICNTWHCRMTTKLSRILLFLIWTVSLVLQLPVLIYYQEFSDNTTYQIISMCAPIWPNYDLQKSYFVVGLFLFCYAIPLVLIILCYVLITIRVWTRNVPGAANNSSIIQKSKIKVIKMIAVVVSLFALSWLPQYVVRFTLFFGPSPKTQEELDTLTNSIVPMLQWISLSNSGINPIIYCLFSKKYRRGFRTLLQCYNYGFTRGHSTTCKYLTNDGSTRFAREPRRHPRLYSPARFMSVEYSNGHMTVSFRNKEDDEETITSSSAGN